MGNMCIKKSKQPVKKEKFNLKNKKENIVCSLFEVEKFLCNFKNVIKGVKLYKILKH